MEEEGEDGGRWGKWRKRITRVFTGGKEKEKEKGREGSKGSVEELPRIVVSQFSCKSRVFRSKPNARLWRRKFLLQFLLLPKLQFALSGEQP